MECTYDKPTRRVPTEVVSIIEGQQSNYSAANSWPLSESLVFGTLQSSATTLFNEISGSPADVNHEVDDWISYTGGYQLTSPATNPAIWQPTLEFGHSAKDQDDAVQSSISMALANIFQGNPSSKYAAGLLTHAISAFPQMMLRRQTLPPFIHGHWHMPSLPETLANCMSVAQIFATRTPETRPFLWRMVGAELQRLQDEVCTYHWLFISCRNSTNNV